MPKTIRDGQRYIMLLVMNPTKTQYDYTVARSLIEAGAELNLQDREGRTPLAVQQQQQRRR